MITSATNEETAGCNRRSEPIPNHHEGENNMIVSQEIAEKYSDYTVEIGWTSTSVFSKVQDGQVIRLCAWFYRVPSEKRFVANIRTDASPSDRAKIEAWARELPRGGWAAFPDRWFRYLRADERTYGFAQEVGLVVDFDYVEYELQMMLPADVDMPRSEHALAR